MDYLKKIVCRIFNLIENKNHRARKSVAVTLAAVIVFVTVYNLILPAITLENDVAQEMSGIDFETVDTDFVSVDETSGQAYLFEENSDIIETPEQTSAEENEISEEPEQPAQDEQVSEEAGPQDQPADILTTEIQPADEASADDQSIEDPETPADTTPFETVEPAQSYDEEAVGEDLPVEGAVNEPSTAEPTDEVFTQEIPDDSIIDGIITDFDSDFEIGQQEETPAALEAMPEQIFEAESTFVKVSIYAEEGAFPEGTTMTAKDVEDEDTIEAITDTIERKIVAVHAVDITFQNAEGEEIEPALPIRVVMTPVETITDTMDEEPEAVVIHVDDEGETVVVEQTDVNEELVQEIEEIPEITQELTPDTVIFDADAFSVYALVYTVDFHYEVNGKTYDFSIPGGGFTTLEHIVEMLGIEESDADDASAFSSSDAVRKFVDDVESVTFSNPKLISVSKVEENTTVGAIKDGLGLVCEYSAELTEEEIARINSSNVESGDWLLISLKPFTSDETLNVKMINGDEFVIRVTDAVGDYDLENSDDNVTVYLGFYNGDAKGGISSPVNILSLSEKYYINNRKTGNYAEISVKSGSILTLDQFKCGSTYTFIGWVDIDKNNKIVSLDENGFNAVITSDMDGDHILAVHIHATRVNAFVNSEIMGKVYSGSDDITNKFAHLTTSDNITARANANYIFALWKAKTDKMTDSITLNSNLTSVKFNDFTGITAGENSYITAYFRPIESNQYKINYKTAIISGSTKTIYDSLNCDGGSITAFEEPIIDLSSGTMQDPGTLELIDSFKVDASVSNDDYVFVGWYTRGSGDTNFPTDRATSNASNSLNSGKVYKPSYLDAGYEAVDLIAVFAKKNIEVTYNTKKTDDTEIWGISLNGGMYKDLSATSSANQKNYYSSVTEILTYNADTNQYDSRGVLFDRNEAYIKGFVGWFSEDDTIVSHNLSFSVTDELLKYGTKFTAKTRAENGQRFRYALIGEGEYSNSILQNHDYSNSEAKNVSVVLPVGYVIDHWEYSYNDYASDVISSKGKTVEITDYIENSLNRDSVLELLKKLYSDITGYVDGVNTFTVYTKFKTLTINYESNDLSIGSVTKSNEQLTDIDGSLSGSSATVDYPDNGYFDGWYLGDELICGADENNGNKYVPSDTDIQKFIKYCSDNNTDEVTITAKFSNAEVITINYVASEHGFVSNLKDQYAGSGRAKGSTATPEEEFEFFGWYFSDGTLALNAETISASDLIGWKETGKIQDGDTLTAKFGKGYNIVYQKQINNDIPETIGEEHITTNSPEGRTAEVISGHNFLGWFIGETLATPNPNLTAENIGTVSSDMAFIAKYATAFVADYKVEHVNAEKPDVSTYGQIVVGSESTTSFTTQNANTKNILSGGATAIPARGCDFVGWEVSENGTVLTVEQVQANYGIDTSSTSIPAGIKIENNVTFKAKFQKQSGAMEIIYTIQQEATDRNYGAQITVNGVSKSGTANETAYLSEVVPEGQNALGCEATGMSNFPSGADNHVWNYNIKGWAEGDNAFVDNKDGADYATKDHLITLSNIFVPTGEYLEDKDHTGVRYFRVVPKREVNIYLLRQVSIAEGGFWARSFGKDHADNRLSYLNNTTTPVKESVISNASNDQGINYFHLYITEGYTLEGFTVNGKTVDLLSPIVSQSSTENYDINSERLAIDENVYGAKTLFEYIKKETSLYFGSLATNADPAINILIARFIAPGYNIEYHVKNGVGGTVSNNGDAYSKEEKTSGKKTDGKALINGSTAIADSGNDYVFVKWEDAEGSTVSNDPHYTPGVEAISKISPYVYHYYAVFEKRDKLTVLYEPDDPSHGVTNPGSETVHEGIASNGSLATAYEGYIFSHWTREGSDEVISENPNFVPNVYGVPNADTYHVTKEDFEACKPVKFIAHFRTKIDSKITVSKVVNVSDGLLKDDVDTIIYVGLTRNGVEVTDRKGQPLIKEIVIENGIPQNTVTFEGLPYNEISDSNDRYEIWEMHKVGSVYERQYIGMLIGDDYQLTAISTSNNSVVTSREGNGTFTDGNGNNAVLTDNHREATVTLTNTYSKETDTVIFEVIKEWQDSDGKQLNEKSIPDGAKVELTVYSENAGVTRAVKSIWLDGTADENGEKTAWKATFENLPKFASDRETELTYKVRETGLWEGYKPYINSGSTYLSENIYLYNNGGKIINKADKEDTTLITVQKIDKQDDSKLLAGATFYLTKKNDSDVYESFNDGSHSNGIYSVGGVGDGLGLFSVALPDGNYQIQETTSPEGYVIVTGAFNFTIENRSLSGTDGDYISFDPDNMMITIKNEPGVALPSTGGPGTRLIYRLGSILVLVAGLLLWRRRRLA